MNNVEPKYFFTIRHFARMLSRHPNWALLIAILLTLFSVWKARDLVVEMDLADLLPKDLEVVRITQSALQDFGSFDFMLVVLEAENLNDEAMMKKAADELAYGLDYRKFIRRVTHKIDPASLNLDTLDGKARAVSLLTAEDWDSLESRLTPEAIDGSIKRLVSLLNVSPYSKYKEVTQDPLNFSKVIAERTEIKSGPLKVNLKENYFLSEDKEMLLMLVWPIEPATNLTFARDFQMFLEETKKGIYTRNPEFLGEDPENPKINISFYGSHYEAITDSEIVRNDFFRTSIYSLIAVLMLFFVAFRRPEALLFIIVPLVIGVAWTLGVSSVMVGRLTQVTISFAAILVGLGVDFSIHLYNRYLEEINKGFSNREAMSTTIAETGPGIIAGAITTAISFVGLMVTRFVGFQELGQIVGVGVIACLLAVLLVLPPMLTVFGTGFFGKYSQREMSTFGLKRFHFTAYAYPRLTVVTGLLVTVFLGTFAADVKFDDDFSALHKASDDYIALRERIQSHFSVPENQLVVVASGSNAQEALAENDKLFDNIRDLTRSNKEFAVVVDSLRYFIPSAETQKIQLQRMANIEVESLRLTINRISRENNLSPKVFDEFIQQLTDFKTASTQAIEQNKIPINILKLDRNTNPALVDIAQRYTYKSRDGRWRILTQIYPPPTEEWREQVPKVFREGMNARLINEVEVTGTLIIQQQLRELIIRDLALAVLLVLFAIMFVLIIYFKSFFKAALAILPVIMGMLCTLGIMSMLEMKLHYINIIALPMIVGIGVDSGIHMIHRFYEKNSMDLDATVTQTGRAIVITSFTTICGFGALALADYQGIRDLGIVSILGVSTTLLASLIMLPSLLRLTEEDVIEQGGEGDSIG